MHAHAVVDFEKPEHLVEDRHQHRAAADAEHPRHQPGDEAGDGDYRGETGQFARRHLHPRHPQSPICFDVASRSKVQCKSTHGAPGRRR